MFAKLAIPDVSFEHFCIRELLRNADYVQKLFFNDSELEHSFDLTLFKWSSRKYFFSLTFNALLTKFILKMLTTAIMAGLKGKI